ncbi:hypothetical protein BDV25DRAFT_143531 [Aspergillus avenaceus]|uniref:Zn(2)-C6 fungal-type domain-containing protein n=1 Tax=Aspergillus avenaceus TaxID=36643 RepID=A0A5N6TJQ9_ASPAV|nr:hypothetical protein BDV25DRAFT_143531 [Aspergillus avenaceus]
MLSSFPLPQDPLPKRRKVGRACDFCRERRVRCDPSSPCTPCVQNNVECIRGTPSPGNARVTEEQSAQHAPHGEYMGSGVITQPEPMAVASPSAAPPQTLLYLLGSNNTSCRMDSVVGFVSQINAFCSGGTAPHLRESVTSGSPALAHTSPFCFKVREEMQSKGCTLSSSQIKRLLGIFWTRLWPQVPIVRQEDLQSSSWSLALEQAIIACCMQFVYHSRLHRRLLGLQWPEFDPTSAHDIVGLPYFQSALSSTTLFEIFADPSLIHVQCYCFMALYLLDAGQHQTAYNMIGMAIRIAQSLALDVDPPPSLDTGKATLRRRIWWTLLHLDFRCCRYIGDTSYHTASLRLTAAALAVMEESGHSSPVGDNVNLETQAERLTNQLHHLNHWRSEVSNIAQLNLNEDNPLPEIEETNNTDPQHSPLQTLLCTVLELQHHEVMIALYRIFIKFPTHQPPHTSSPRADAHAATALNHAVSSMSQKLIQIRQGVLTNARKKFWPTDPIVLSTIIISNSPFLINSARKKCAFFAIIVILLTLETR